MDPKRWMDDDATPLERELLAAGQAVKMPSEQRRAVWMGIAGAAAVASIGLSAGTASGGAAAQALGAGAGAGVSASTVTVAIAKGALVLSLLGGSVGAGYWTLARGPLAKHAPPALDRPALVHGVASPPPPEAPSEDLAAPPKAEAVRSRAAPVPGRPAHNEASSESGRTSRLSEESVAVLEARTALRNGDPGGSLRLLDQLKARFPDGALTQEREALAIEALSRSGQKDAASRRADAFLRAFPRSPYTADVRAFIAR